MQGYRKMFVTILALGIVCFLAYATKLDIQAASVLGTITVTFLTTNTIVNKGSKE